MPGFAADVPVAVIAAILGVLVAVNLFLVMELSHPFLGDVGTSSEPLKEVIRQLS